jgi:Zn-dependent protease with chaperone function
MRSYFAVASFVSVCAFPGDAQILKLTEPQEIEVGRRAAAEIEFAQPLIEDRTILQFIQTTGLRLARESDRPGLRFYFKVLASDDANAFALPGGFIYVTRGLIEAVQDEAELAAALAHEIGHIAARQHAGKIRRTQLANLGVSFLGPVAGGGLRATAAIRGGRSGARGLFMRFTKENEREADRIGAKILYDTGYDPNAMVRLLQRFASLQDYDPGLVRQYYSSHAKKGDRVESLTEYIASLPVRPAKRGAGPEFTRLQAHVAAIKPKEARSSSAAVAEILLAAEDEPDSQAAKDREVAALFAPLFYHGVGNEPRYDWITNFDFDGDWRGDNNWANAARREFPLRAWVYYSVRETRTHLFLHYAVFHPRDYKGGAGKGRLLSKVFQTAAKPAAAIDPTGRASEVVLAHENDLEGALIVVEKQGSNPENGRVVFVETLAHNNFLKYAPADEAREGFAPFLQQGRRVMLYIEPRGHGIEAYHPQVHAAKTPIRLFNFTGHAEVPEDDGVSPVGYDLVPIDTTLWAEAQRGLTPTYAEVQDYGIVLIEMAEGEHDREVTWEVGPLGSAFRGRVGGENLARPPWGWFDGKDRDVPLGQWFLDPARTVRRDYGLEESFSIAYLRPWPEPEFIEDSQ